jgi:hypothetical protein
MKRKFIPTTESFAHWKKDPRYAVAYAALEGEFALASSLIKARSEASMTQGAGCRGHGNHPGRGCPPGKRQGTAFHPHAGALRQCDSLPATDHLRASTQIRALNRNRAKRTPALLKARGLPASPCHRTGRER